MDFNATQAAIRAGYSPKTAGSQGFDLLKLPEIQEAIEERKAEVLAAAGVTVEFVLRQWMQIAAADPNELIEVRKVNCRHCHGVMHAYQWTEQEYLAACEIAIARKKPVPDGMGGFGYDVNREPSPDCPECGGHGHEREIIKDTRRLKGNARRLYAGAQRTKDGIKILFRDQDAAVNNLAKYLGMLIDKKEIGGPNGGPIAVANLKAEDFTDDQLASILAAAEN